MTIIYTNVQDIPEAAYGTATALGNFDGVHRGHACLLQQLRQHCPDRPLSVVTFDPHPRQVFSPDGVSFRLTDTRERNAILEEMGIDYIFQIHFDRAFAALTAHGFIHNILHDSFRVSHIACGQGFEFGHQRQGNVDYLKSEAGLLGIGVTVVKPLMDGNGIISSSRIRACLKEGKPEQASDLLGRVWTIQNIVQHGDKRGRQIGFPTANLSLGEQLEPKCGVYAVRVTLADGRVCNGVANIGYRPTVGHQDKCCLEAHLFDFDQDIYGQEISVALYHFIRPEKRFNGLDALKEQIVRDITDAKHFFHALG